MAAETPVSAAADPARAPCADRHRRRRTQRHQRHHARRAGARRRARRSPAAGRREESDRVLRGRAPAGHQQTAQAPPAHSRRQRPPHRARRMARAGRARAAAGSDRDGAPRLRRSIRCGATSTRARCACCRSGARCSTPCAWTCATWWRCATRSASRAPVPASIRSAARRSRAIWNGWSTSCPTSASCGTALRRRRLRSRPRRAGAPVRAHRRAPRPARRPRTARPRSAVRRRVSARRACGTRVFTDGDLVGDARVNQLTRDAYAWLRRLATDESDPGDRTRVAGLGRHRAPAHGDGAGVAPRRSRAGRPAARAMEPVRPCPGARPAWRRFRRG